jgi:hypothetical protein
MQQRLLPSAGEFIRSHELGPSQSNELRLLAITADSRQYGEKVKKRISDYV